MYPVLAADMLYSSSVLTTTEALPSAPVVIVLAITVPLTVCVTVIATPARTLLSVDFSTVKYYCHISCSYALYILNYSIFIRVKVSHSQECTNKFSICKAQILQAHDSLIHAEHLFQLQNCL